VNRNGAKPGVLGAGRMAGPKAGPSKSQAAQEMCAKPSLAGLPDPAAAVRYDLRILQALRRIMRAVDLYSRKLLAGHKVTGPQLVCLLSVQEHEPVTLSAIARHVHLSPSTVTGILDRLEHKGLVRRERDLKDRRLVHVALTERGRELAVRAPSPLQDTLAEAMKGLPKTEQATIAASLDRIVEMMEIRHIDAAPILETGLIALTPGETKAVEPPDR